MIFKARSDFENDRSKLVFWYTHNRRSPLPVAWLNLHPVGLNYLINPSPTVANNSHKFSDR